MSDARPNRRKHVVWKVIQKRGMLLNLESGEYFETGPVGLTVWELCDGRRTLDAVVESVARRFATLPQRVARDVGSFVSELKRRDLIEMK